MYDASLKRKWDENVIKDYAIQEGVRQERARLAEEIEMLKAKADQERAKADQERAKADQERAKAKEKLAKAEADKLATAKSIKEMGILTDQQLADKFNLPLAIIEKL